MPAPGFTHPTEAWFTEANGLGLPVLLCEDGGRIVAASDRLRRMLGQDPPQGPRALEALLTAAGVAQAGARIDAALEAPQTVLLTVGGRRRPAELRGHRRDDGLLVFSLLPVACSEAQDQQRARFQSLIAHDIRSPLAVIQGYAGLLGTGQAGPLTENQREFLGGIDVKITELVRLLDDFLDYQRLEAGALSLAPEPVNVEDLAGQVVDEYGRRARLRGLAIEYDAEPDLPPVQADPLRLRQVLDNLISNAVKYADPDTWIRVGIAASGDGVGLEVSDGGPGLPPDVLATIFEPYRRSESHRHIAGTGLGLVVVKQLVEAMGGSIAASQPSGAGLCFRVVLPTA